MKEPLLSAQNLTKSFSGEPVLNAINLAVFPGDFTVIMGPSGAGKSTLLYCLSGMDSATSGQVLYKGQELGKLSERKLAALRGLEFGFVFQQANLVSNLTLLENVTVAGYLDKARPGDRTRARAAKLLESMGLKEACHRMPSQVSGGEAQRAAMARAVVNLPGLLFADEPTGALNRKNSEEVLNLLSRLHSQGQTILLVTHDVKAALRGTRVLYLEDGKILDELALPPYGQEDAKEREERLTDWLSALSW